MFLFKTQPKIAEVCKQIKALGYRIRFVNAEQCSSGAVGLCDYGKKVISVGYKLKNWDLVYFILCHEYHHAKQHRYGSMYFQGKDGNAVKEAALERKADEYAYNMTKDMESKSTMLRIYIEHYLNSLKTPPNTPVA
jgi:Zn-dependent peptidase ImmA (M78 family)